MSDADLAAALTTEPALRASRLLALVEDQWFDRKSARIDPRKLAETLIAFANADGGTVVIGLRAGTVEGVNADPRRLNALRQTAIDHTEPMLDMTVRMYDCVRDDGTPDELLVIEVPPSSTVHSTKRDEVLLRIGDENHRLTFAQRRELLFDKHQSTYEAEVTQVPESAIDEQALNSYLDALSSTDSSRVMQARGLANNGKLTVAGLLLLGAEPGLVLPSAHVRVSRFRGTEREFGARQNLASDVRAEGPIPTQLEQARAAVRAVQPTRRALARSGRFEDIGLVPEDAWLEGLVNAVVHRSYSNHGDHIHVNVYDDRIVIESPGRFPGLVDLSNPLEVTRFARNPRIARACTDLRITQEIGEGIRRIYREMRDAGLNDPLYHQTAGSVQLTLSGEPTSRRLTEKLPVIQQHIVAELRVADRLSTGEVAQAIGSTAPTAGKHLRLLESAGLVTWVGKSPRDPRAYWTLS